MEKAVRRIIWLPVCENSRHGTISENHDSVLIPLLVPALLLVLISIVVSVLVAVLVAVLVLVSGSVPGPDVGLGRGAPGCSRSVGKARFVNGEKRFLRCKPVGRC